MGWMSLTSRRACFFMALGLAFFGRSSFAQPAADASAPAKTSVKLTGAVFEMPAGAPYIDAKDGLYCIASI